jgi:hypothetical protein
LVFSLSGVAYADDAPTTPPSTDPATNPTPAAKPESTSPIPTTDEQILYALGIRARYLAVPGFMLSPFLQQFTTLSSGGFGAELTRRKGTLDIVLSLDFSFYSPPDGNYLGSGKDPSLDTHYTQFKGLNFLSLDVGFIWVHDLTNWLAIMIGGGVGIGIVLGDINTVNNSNAVCNASNAGDTSKCYPINPQNGMAVKPTDPNFQQELMMLQSMKDTAQNPNYHTSPDKPPVMVVVNFIVGFKLKLHRHFNFNISGGFRDGFVFGGGPEYVF